MNINNINEAFSRIIKEEFDNKINAASKEALNDTEGYVERIINFLEDNLGGVKFNKNSYGDYTLKNAVPEDLDEVESLLKDLGYTPRFNQKDFVSPDKSTAITTWFDGKDIRLFFVFRRDGELKEESEKKERAPRRPKNVCGSLENEVEMRLADELFTSFQKTPSWPFRPGYYDIENEMGVAREDGENGFRVFTVTTPVAKDRLGKAKEIAKEYGLKTEYVAPNNRIGKSNEMLKIYIPMDAPSPFDEKRMREWEEKTKAFKSGKNEKLDENLEGNLTSDLYNAVSDALFKYKDYFDDSNSLKMYIKETVPYLVDKFFIENPNLEEGNVISEDTVKRNGKWVNKGKDGTHGTFKTKRAADAQRKAMFANGYKESLENDNGWSSEIIEVCADLLQDMDTLSYAIRNNVRDSAGEGSTTTDLADTLRAFADEALRTADNLEYDSEKLDESKSIKESVSHSFNIGDTFQNINKTFVIDDIKGDYTLVHSDELKFMPYIVAWKLSDDGSWNQGHYFKTREEAEEYLSKE